MCTFACDSQRRLELDSADVVELDDEILVEKVQVAQGGLPWEQEKNSHFEPKSTQSALLPLKMLPWAAAFDPAGTEAKSSQSQL